MSRKGNRGKKPKIPNDQAGRDGALDIVSETMPAEDAANYNHNDKHEAAATKRLAVHVATPAYDGKVDADFASSMLMAGQLCTTQLIECSSAVIGNGAFIEIARNVLVKQFLQSEETKHFTHFMFVDSDLWFEPRGIPGLVRSGLPVTSGAYRRRQDEESYPIRWTPLPKEDEREPDRLWMNGGWVRCDRVATGFLCIEREVLEKMTELAIEEGRVWDLPDQGPTPALFYTKIEDGKFVGEDICWCDDYMRYFEQGIFDEPIWVWPDFDFIHGGYKCNWQHWLAEHTNRDAQGNKKRRLGRRRK